MRNKEIILSLFIPSLLITYDLNKNLIFIPLNRGLLAFVERGNSLEFININNENTINELKSSYDDFVKKRKISISFYSEVPLIWQLNIFYSLYLATEIIKYIMDNDKTEIRINEIIENCLKLANNKKYSSFPYLAYKFKKGALLNRKTGYVEPLNKITNDIYIVCFYETKVKIEDLTSIQLGEFNKNIQKVGDADIFLVNRTNIVEKLEELIKTYKPENILIAKHYGGGIKIYKHQEA